MRKSKLESLAGMKGIIAIVIIAVLVIGIDIKMFNFNDKEYIVTVTDKDRITESKKDSDGNKETTSKYIVYGDGENGESLVFENTDCFIRFKFNSSNIQGQLKEGHTYKLTVIGYRVPFLSWYENIIKVEEIE